MRLYHLLRYELLYITCYIFLFDFPSLQITGFFYGVFDGVALRGCKNCDRAHITWHALGRRLLFALSVFHLPNFIGGHLPCSLPFLMHTDFGFSVAFSGPVKDLFVPLFFNILGISRIRLWTCSRRESCFPAQFGRRDHQGLDGF